MENESIGLAIREISLYIKHNINERVTKRANGITQMGGLILHIIKKAEENNEELCQKDLEAKFKTSKSTMCEMLNCLEKHDFINRVPSKVDSRKNVITLTNLGREVDLEVDNEIKEFEKSLDDKITSEEKEMLLSTLKKLMKEEK